MFYLDSFQLKKSIKVLLENGWNSKQMITEGEAANYVVDDSARLP